MFAGGSHPGVDSLKIVFARGLHPEVDLEYEWQNAKVLGIAFSLTRRTRMVKNRQSAPATTSNI